MGPLAPTHIKAGGSSTEWRSHGDLDIAGVMDGTVHGAASCGLQMDVHGSQEIALCALCAMGGLSLSAHPRWWPQCRPRTQPPPARVCAGGRGGRRGSGAPPMPGNLGVGQLQAAVAGSSPECVVGGWVGGFAVCVARHLPLRTSLAPAPSAACHPASSSATST